MPKYAITITEANMDIVMFLNDGIRPQVEEREQAYLICEVNAPREITTKVMYENELYDDLGMLKERMTVLV